MSLEINVIFIQADICKLNPINIASWWGGNVLLWRNGVIKFRIMERTQTAGSVITEVINMSEDKDLRAWADKLDCHQG
ncbi:MAG: hypothetical protein NVSMB24_27240 [Mucilaginibacter sp.]